MKSTRKLLSAFLALCLVLNFVFPVPVRAAENTHTIVLSSTQNSDGSYSHTALYDGAAVNEYDYTWHADPSTVHSEVSNSPAEYYTGTEPGNEAVYIAHDIYYYPELPTSGFVKQSYDGEQEWCYYYTAEGYTGYIFSTLPGRSSLPTDMMHSAEDAYQNAVLHITQPGTYTVQGNWHGQIWVDLENYCDDPFTDPTAKVELVLNGVTIDCTVAAGLVFHNVYECDNTWEDQSSWSYNVDTSAAGAVVTLADDTVNSVSGTNIFRILKTQYKSGSTSVQKKRLKIDGSFYSYQSMAIQGGAKGTGVLNITAGYEGMNSELHLTINGGNVNIFSQDDGINVNEDNVSVLTINGGTLHILAGLGSEGDGIDSNGYISVNGGTVITMANPGADSGMDSDFGTYVFGGNVIALGATMDWATNDSSVSYDQAIMNLQFSSSKSAGDAIIITDSNGNGIFAYDPDKDEVNGSTVRTYTGAIIASENMTIGGSYNVYIGGEVTGTETKGIYDMSTVTAVSNTYQQSYSSTGSSGSRPTPGGSSGSTGGSGGTATFSLTNNVTKFSGVANYSSATNITVTPTESGTTEPEQPAAQTYYLVGYINGANYGCEEDYENMGAYKFVDGKLTATFDQDSYVFVKTESNGAWYMAQSYCTDTTCSLYNTSTGASEKLFVPGNVAVTFTLTENSDGSLSLSYTTASTECSHSYTSQITTAATCTTNGVRTYTCSKCGNSYTEVIAATGHSYANGSCTVCGAADPDYTVTDGSYVRVTSLDEITAGGKFVIVADNNGTYYAMNTSLSNGKASGVSVTVSGNVVTGSDLPVWTIAAVDGGISLYANSTYLKYNSSSNFTTSATAYAWTVSAGDSGYTVKASSSNRAIYFRTSSSVFGPYSTFNSMMGGYVSQLLLFKYVEPVECTHSYTEEVTTAASCEADGVKTLTCTLCGDAYTETIPATGHSYKTAVTAPNCTEGGYTTYTCSNCGDTYTADETAATGHSFANGSCTVCGAADPSYVAPATVYYLVGYINGADHGCEGDYENMGDYKFVDGKLTTTFTADSYVFVKTEGNGKWLLADSYCTDTTCTFSEGKSEKMFVPGNVEVTFTLTENADGSVTLSYTTGSSASTVPTLTLKAPTLEFKDMITVNAFYTAENIEDVVEMGMITYSSQVSSWSVDTAENVIPGATYDAASGRYYSCSQGIHAKYLGDTVYLAVYAKLTDGTYAYSKLASYSAVTYATNQLKNSTDTSLKQLVAAMLNYGAEAQLYFGHNTGSLANASLTAEQLALPETYRADMVSSVPAASAAKQGSFTNNSGFSSRKPAISFEGAFCINYFFTPNYAPDNGITLYYWNAADYDAASVLTTANASGSIQMSGSDTGEYRGDITGISAKALSDAVYVAAVYTNGGTTWTSGVLGYSIGAYCSNQASAGGDIAALAMATAVYGYHAKQYFG